MHQEVCHVGIEQVVHVLGQKFVHVAHHAGNRNRVIEEAVTLQGFGVDGQILHGGPRVLLCYARLFGGGHGGHLVVVELLLQKRCDVGEALADAFLFAGIPFGQDFVCQGVDSARELAQVHFGTFDNRIFRGHIKLHSLQKAL